jgi:MYXO-CTERM domain-containing protein
MHISDLHIDNDGSTVNANTAFALGEGVTVIHPVFLFASGDLVNGSILKIPTSGQDQSEWDDYKQIFKASGLTSAFYFDMPGNHDGYGDNGLTHYLSNSVQGQLTGKLFSDTSYTTKYGDYYFACLDSAGTYDKPLSYGNPEFTNVDDYQAGLTKHKDAQLNFAFAHHHLVPHGDTGLQDKYGIGGSDDPPKNVAAVSKMMEDNGTFYMHGHIHQYKESMQGKVLTNQIGGLGFNGAVDRSSNNAYENTKYNTNIGVGIVDHNAFIYRTTSANDPWPFVAITAPVDQYLQGGGTPPGTSSGISYEGDQIAYGTEKNPYTYDVCNTKTKSPVRALVLAKDAIKSVKLLIDGQEASALIAAKDPQGIWTGSFDATTIGLGMHELGVEASTAKESRIDKITIQVVSGAGCTSPSDAGVDGDSGPVDSGSDSGKADTGTDAGLDASDAGDSGHDADATTKDGGADGAKDSATTDATQSDSGLVQDDTPQDSGTDSGGCSCSTGAEGKKSYGIFALLGVMGLALKRRNRRES